jgi:hypothetical protein
MGLHTRRYSGTKRAIVVAVATVTGGTGLLLGALPASATGVQVYTNGGNSGSYGGFCVTSEAEPFQLATAAPVISVSAPLVGSASVQLSIETDNAGSPSGTVLATTSYSYVGEADFSTPVDLSAGVTYWVVLSAGGDVFCSDPLWELGSSEPGAYYWQGGWSPGYNWSITLYGPAPIPTLTPTLAPPPPSGESAIMPTEVSMANPGSQVTLSAELGLASSNGNGGLLATGSALSGQTLTFTVGSNTCSATTDAEGIASCSLAAPTTPGGAEVTISFAGSHLVTPSVNYSQVDVS